MQKQTIHENGKYCAGPKCDCGYGKHTATPWKANLNTSENIYYIHNREGMMIARIGTIRNETESNASYIVKAVNSHESLVNLLKRFIDPSGNDCPTDQEVREALKLAEEA